MKRYMPSGKIICIALWSLVLAVILIRIVHTPGRNNVLSTYITAGHHWLHGEPLYKGSRGFVYSPIAAAIFAPMSLLPTAVSAILWRILITGIYLAAVWRWLEAGFYPELARDRYWIVFLLLLPISIGNINSGQVNTIVIGLLMLGIVMAHRTQWWIAAFSIAGAVYLKIYPLAVAMLVMVVFPKKFSWRFLATLIVIGAVTFMLQKPTYVWDQYQLWIATRAFDNQRHFLPQSEVQRDLWLLLRVLHLQISEHLYVLVQILSGCAVGVVCLLGHLRRWEQGPLLATLLSLGCVWMLLCGPATESATYFLIAPMIACALCQVYLQSHSLLLRVLVTVSYGMLLAGLGINSFLHRPKTFYAMSLQPFGVLIFLCFIVMTLLRMRPRTCHHPVSRSTAMPAE
jgi:glycosyl transferase family 87